MINPSTDTPTSLALSGGGFRATLFHLGVIRYLCETGRLSSIKKIYAVSGGSILAAHLALHWDEYCDKDTFPERAKEIIDFTQRDVRNKVLKVYLYWWTFTICILSSIASAVWGLLAPARIAFDNIPVPWDLKVGVLIGALLASVVVLIPPLFTFLGFLFYRLNLLWNKKARKPRTILTTLSSILLWPMNMSRLVVMEEI